MVTLILITEWVLIIEEPTLQLRALPIYVAPFFEKNNQAEQASSVGGPRSPNAHSGGSTPRGSADDRCLAEKKSSRLRRMSVSLSPSTLRAKLRSATAARESDSSVPTETPLPEAAAASAASSPSRSSFRRRVSMSLSPSTVRAAMRSSAANPGSQKEGSSTAAQIIEIDAPTDSQPATPLERQSPPSPTSKYLRRKLSVSIDYTRQRLSFSRPVSNPLQPATAGELPPPLQPTSPRVQRRRDSMSLSPSSLRAAMKQATGHIGGRQGGDDRAAVDAEASGSTKTVGTAKKMTRGRSMSMAFIGRGAFNISAPGSPTSSSTTRGSRSPGFRGRLRQRRQWSPSAPHGGRGWGAGALEGGAGGGGGWRPQWGVPSLLDTVPRWKRPKLLGDLRRR